MGDREVQGPLEHVTFKNRGGVENILIFHRKFPFTSRTNRPANDLYSYQELLKRVTAAMNHYCRDVGNVISWVAQDLNGRNAEPERELLPKLYGEHKGQGQKYTLHNRAKHVNDSDYVHAYYDISGCCKAMLKEKIERAQRQHAHDLAIEGKIDIRVTWLCKPDKATGGFNANIVMATPEDADVMKIASDSSYNFLNWDEQHYKEPEMTAKQKAKQGMAFGGHGNGNGNSKGKGRANDANQSPASASPSESAKPPSPIIPTPDPDYRGGFYTVVTHDVYRSLLIMAREWGLTITTILEPKRMTTAELAEMKAYYNFRNLPKVQYEREVHFRKHGAYPETAEERDRRIVRGCEENLEKRLAAKRSEMKKKNEDGPGGAAMWGMLFD
ncbi:hypothetical protein BDV96DRAFT_597305 [Lophiotrema nucula]|uniref:Uncharacterized protein n=1 Tax=Lophiotrema nucula TaxID=690887 RepID=A0A6A5ZI35_9PLEO|nr:hypothetical protein BDV96DRAFT_597305 [Lophiotrema nucula]